MNSITAQALKQCFVAGGEIALLDVREHGEYGSAHPFHAVNLPFSRFEAEIEARVPRRQAPIVIMDQEGEGRARQCAGIATAMGYDDVRVLAGGAAAWQAAGYNMFAGVNVPSKAFGELVHERFHPPSITARALADWQARGTPVKVFDVRPVSEYRKMTIPGSICCPNGELVKRLPALLPDAAAPVVLNCAGRTRGIIGAQTLRWLGLSNPVYALENGTQGWRLAGLELEHGGDRLYPAAAETDTAMAAGAQALARRHGAHEVDAETLSAWLADGARTTYVLDVRTAEEHAADHLPGAAHAPGGQLIQATDQWVGVYRARLVLVDDDACRAPVVATWLTLMGWETAWLKGGRRYWRDIRPAARRASTRGPMLPSLAPASLEDVLRGDALCLDLRPSMHYRAAHLPGARWVNRALLDAQLRDISRNTPLILIADHDAVAAILAADLTARGFNPPRRLAFDAARCAAAGVTPETTPQEPSDDACIDYLFFVHDRHDGNLEASRRYLAWETGLTAQLDAEERATFAL